MIDILIGVFFWFVVDVIVEFRSILFLKFIFEVKFLDCLIKMELERNLVCLDFFVFKDFLGKEGFELFFRKYFLMNVRSFFVFEKVDM